MKTKLVLKIITKIKMRLTLWIGVLIFCCIGLYFIMPVKDYDQIKLDTHNFYLSIKSPKLSKIISYYEETRIGNPVVSSHFIIEGNLDIKKIEKQLKNQGWKFYGKRIYEKEKIESFVYEKQGYHYILSVYDKKNQWEEYVEKNKNYGI